LPLTHVLLAVAILLVDISTMKKVGRSEVRITLWVPSIRGTVLKFSSSAVADRPRDTLKIALPCGWPAMQRKKENLVT